MNAYGGSGGVYPRILDLIFEELTAASMKKNGIWRLEVCLLRGLMHFVSSGLIFRPV
jgi:hypothetical protein